MALKIAAFPKCYIDQIAGDRSMSVFDWIEMSPPRCRWPGDVRRVFHESQPLYVDRVAEAIAAQVLPCRCCAARPISRTPMADANAGGA